MSVIGRKLVLTIFGQSHSEAVGFSLDGFPAGLRLDFAAYKRFMARRAPGGREYSTSRREADEVEFVSGFAGGVTCGAPVCGLIRNTDVRRSDYDALRVLPRPSHADYAAYVKYGGLNDASGGGHLSGRLTAPLCAAGGLCLQYLRERGIYVGAHIYSIGSVWDVPFDPLETSREALELPAGRDFPVNDTAASEEMLRLIAEAKSEGDSVGGIVECMVIGMPAGVGEPLFDGVENRISAAVFGIPGVKGIEFGSGFAGSRLRGSENNDGFIVSETGEIRTRTNSHGGILGGMTSGMPVIFRAAVKPTPSIAKEQESVELTTKKPELIKIGGRHDPCIVPRAVPCVEAAAAFAVCDLLLSN